MIVTYRYRVKDKHSKRLNRMAASVNFVWNYCNDAQKHSLKWNKKWLSTYDLHRLTSGTSNDLGILATTVNMVCLRYVTSRKQSKRPYLRYRSKKSLGWIPFKAESCKRLLRDYSLWLSRPIPEGARFVDGSSFSQDSRGRWYLNLVIDVPETVTATSQAIGVDLGLKALAALSNGETIAIPQPFRKNEERLAKAQRAGKKRQATKIHAKIANQRRDFLHKASTQLTKEYGHIVVGNVSAARLVKTRLAKSVLDAGWSDFRRMLNYKAIARCGTYQEVNEANTTRSCSECGSLSGPKGIAGLGIREWQCFDCDSIHDRDRNAALNILRLRHQTPVEGIAA